LSQNDNLIEAASSAQSKPSVRQENQYMNYYNRWLILLNSSSQSCFYHGLTDVHKESWFTYLNHSQPFSNEVVQKGEIDKQQMASTHLLSQYKLLVPFGDDKYNTSWEGITPSLKQAFPHDKSNINSFFKHRIAASKSKDGDHHNSSSTSSGNLDTVGRALSTLVAFKTQPVESAKQLPKHIQFKRIYNEESRPAFEFTSEVTDLDATLGSFLQKSFLGDQKFRGIWDIGSFKQADIDISWEILILIKLANDFYYTFTWQDAKGKPISSIAADQNVRMPLECTIKIQEKHKPGDNFFEA
jgi:hypothetical protein